MEIVSSFFSNIKDKLTNPFFGTLILVLIIHHWELWYAAMNFDSDCTLDDKLIFIKNYSDKHFIFWELINDLGHAVIFMLFGYLIVVATRSLVLWVEFGLMPFITGKIVNKDVVRRSEYEDVVKERDSYSEQYEEQRKQVRQLSKDYDEITKNFQSQNSAIENLTGTNNRQNLEIDKYTKQVNTLNTTKTNLEAKVQNLEFTLKQKEEDLDQMYSIFSGENEDYWKNIISYPPIIKDLVKKLRDADLMSTFNDVADFIKNGGSISSEPFTLLKPFGVINSVDDRQLSPLGWLLSKYRNFQKYPHL